VNHAHGRNVWPNGAVQVVQVGINNVLACVIEAMFANTCVHRRRLKTRADTAGNNKNIDEENLKKFVSEYSSQVHGYCHYSRIIMKRMIFFCKIVNDE
jgi:hypothetical protein